VILQCEECGCASRGRARGWIALVGEDRDGSEPPCVGLYCPACAGEEFGHRPEQAEDYT
jgi:hypothetical protein